MPYREFSDEPAPPRSDGPTILLTPKGINALAVVEMRRFALLPWWRKMWGLRAHRRVMDGYRRALSPRLG